MHPLASLRRTPHAVVRSRLVLWVVLLLPLSMVLGLFAWNSHLRNLQTQQLVAAQAQNAAQDEARLIKQRLTNQFIELQFAGVALLGPDADPAHPAPNVVRSLHAFIALHANLYAFNIQSADGNHILWSTQSQTNRPITGGSAFTPLSGQPDFLLGEDRFAARVAQAGQGSGHVITMRTRIADTQGHTRFFVGSPYRIEDLLANPALRHTPWTLQVVDSRDHSLLGVVDAQGVHFLERAVPQPHATSLRVTVPGLPLDVLASWSPQAAQRLGLQTQAPWSLLATVTAVLLAAAWAIATLLRRRDWLITHLSAQSHVLSQTNAQLQRMAAMQALLADCNQAIASARDEGALLQQLCNLAVDPGQLALAFIARPDADGRFQFRAAAGKLAYLDGLVISSREDLPEGQGPTGMALRRNEAVFNTDFSAANLAPWRDKARALGLRASAALPIVQDGEVWGVFTVLRADDTDFDAPLQTLLRELALDIGRGLERVRAMQQLLLLRAALDSAADGVLISDIDAITLYVNPAFTQITGYSPQEILGHDCKRLQGPGTDGQTLAAITHAIQQGTAFSGEILNIRKDGTPFWNLLRIDPVRDAHGQLLAFIGTQRNITAQVEQTAHLKRLQRLYQALVAEGDILLQGRNAQEMLDRTCNRLATDALFHAVWIAQRNAQGLLVAVAQAGRGADLTRQLAVPTNHPTALVAAAWRTQSVQVYQDNRAAQADQPWTDAIARADWASALAAPVRRGGTLYAVLVFVADKVGMFDDETSQACARVATLLGYGLDELDLKDRLLQMQRQEALAARTDALTGLPNRFALEQHLPHALERARRHGSTVAVGMIDLDDFKPVNDQFGHDAGDALLRQLAQQLQAQLRGTDYLARLGGDEFVLVLEDLDRAYAEPQLAIILQRLDRVIQAPFDLGQARQARVGMTLGMALFPEDGEDADTLLRNADAAMYQAKARKGERAQWWRLWREGTLAAPQVEAPFDPFGDAARRLLQTLTPILRDIAPEFATAFYAQLLHDPQTAAILHSLAPEEFAHLQSMQAQHLQFLLHPDTTAQSIASRAQHLGQVHALVGLPLGSQLQAFDLYTSLIRAQIERVPLMAQSRYQLLRITQVRLQHDLQGEIAAQQALLSTYHAVLAHALPRQGRWNDLVLPELDRLAALPGLRGVFVFRVDDKGQLRIHASAGDVAQAVQAEIDAKGLHPTIHPGPDGQRGPMGQAWISGTRQVVDAYLQDPRLQPWHAMARRLGVRSAIALPLLRGETVDAVLFLLGAYPHQFSSPLLQAWLDVVQHRGEQLLIASAASLLQRSDAQHRAQWRSLLYQGALRMVVQPVVDLRSGAVTKVEALARLQAEDGGLVGPGQFLPGLGQDDLQVLFRQGLSQSLSALYAWRQSGLDITLSLNLDPTTLVAPDCPLWVERALREADLPPAALTLELLETQEIDARAVDEAIARLRDLGVRLAMDDLGSGYSSMRRLASLPFDVIKIDQDVVQDVARHPLQGIALMRTVLQLGRDMDCAVVAEGLEDAALIEVAMLLGCPLGQGYGLARPMPIETFPEWLHSHAPLHLPSGEDLHSWLGATAYVWSREHDNHLQRHHTGLVACPLTRFLQREAVQNEDALRWHALWHESAFEKERKESGQALLQWMEQQVLARRASAQAQSVGDGREGVS